MQLHVACMNKINTVILININLKHVIVSYKIILHFIVVVIEILNQLSFQEKRNQIQVNIL